VSEEEFEPDDYEPVGDWEQEYWEDETDSWGSE